MRNRLEEKGMDSGVLEASRSQRSREETILKRGRAVPVERAHCPPPLDGANRATKGMNE